MILEPLAMPTASTVSKIISVYKDSYLPFADIFKGETTYLGDSFKQLRMEM